jgi:WD40 repeat protein
MSPIARNQTTLSNRQCGVEIRRAFLLVERKLSVGAKTSFLSLQGGRLAFRLFSQTRRNWINLMWKSRLGEKSWALPPKPNKVARAFCSLLGLALCLQVASAQQGMQQAPPRVAVLGVSAEQAAPPQVPPGSRPPDQVFPAINSWSLGALAFSADGQWLASGGYGDTVMVWNAATGAEQSRLSRPQPANNAVVKLAFSPDGTHLAELRYNGRATVWDFQKATVVSSTKLHSGAGVPLVYSPDGKTWTTSGTAPEGSTVPIEIRDAASGKILRTIPTKWYGIIGLVITKDGMLVASGLTVAGIDDEQDPRGTVEEWELATGKLVKSSPVFDVVGPVSADGQWMVSMTPESSPTRGIFVTNLTNAQVKWTFPQQDAEYVFFSPDAREIAVTSHGSARALSLWSVVTGTVISSMHGEQDLVNSSGLTTVAFSPDGRQVAATEYPVNSVKVWEVATAREVREFAGQPSPQTVAMSPDGRWLVYAAPGVTVRNPANGKIVTTLTTEDADALVFSPDGRWLAADPGVFPSPGSSLLVWDTRTWAVAASVKPERNPHIGAPVQWIAFGGGETAQSKLGYAQSLKFAADGKTQTVWYSAYQVAASPDGKNTGQKLQTFVAHKMVTNSLAFSRDGRWLLTTGQESLRVPVDLHTFSGTTEYRVKLWDVATWKERVSVSYPQMLTYSGVLSPDGKRIAVERSWGLVDLLDVDSGTIAATLAAVIAPSNYGPIFGKGNLAFSADGNLLFEGAFKSGIYVWKLPVP